MRNTDRLIQEREIVGLILVVKESGTEPYPLILFQLVSINLEGDTLSSRCNRVTM